MREPLRRRPASALPTTVAVFGVLVGLAGAEHGVGEVLQGSTRPPGLVIKSWPDAAAFDVVDGEPALTVIPNLLVAGILTLAVSMVVIVWSVRRIGRPVNGWQLIALSAALLLLGGGFGPPVMGFIVGGAAVRAGRQGRYQRRATAALLARWWPLLVVAATAGYLALVPGTVLLSHYAGITSPGLVLALAGFSFSTLVLALIAASAASSRERG